MNRRETKQKRLIFETLLEERSHPTIQELYQKVLEKDQKIGQATVYRNVGRLVDEKKIKRLSISSDQDRYDINDQNHYHLLCTVCGRVFDLYDESYQALLEKTEEDHKIKVLDSSFILNGVCASCLKKN